MNIMDKKSELLQAFSKSLERFPVTLVYSLLWALAALGQSSARLGPFNFASLNLSLGLGTIISLLIGVFLESLERSSHKGDYFLYMLEGLSLYFLYKYLQDISSPMVESKYIGLVLISLVSLGFIARLLRPSNYNFYVLDIIRAGLVGFLNSLVLLLGSYFIIFSLSSLFNIKIDYRIYSYLADIIFTVFFTLVFTSNFPQAEKDYSQARLSQISEKLYSYILIPLLVVYSLILYAFFIKVVLTKTWPQGLVAHLVLWYSLVGLAVLFFTGGSENRLILSFRRFYPVLNLPNLLIMFYAIYLRLAQYGFTNQRYYVLIAGIWVFLMDCFYIFNKKDRTIVVGISLALLLTVSNFGPMSSFNVSLRSQNKRLEKIFLDQGLIKDGRLVKSKKLDLDDREEILDIVSYLDSYGQLDQLKALRGESRQDLEELLTSQLQDGNLSLDLPSRNFIYNYSGGLDKITGYDYLYRPSSWTSDSYEIGTIELRLENYILIIEDGGQSQEFNLGQLISEKYRLAELDPREEVELNLSLGQSQFLVRVHFISGSLINQGEGLAKAGLSIDRMEAYILIKATD